VFGRPSREAPREGDQLGSRTGPALLRETQVATFVSRGSDHGRSSPRVVPANAPAKLRTSQIRPAWRSYAHSENRSSTSAFVRPAGRDARLTRRQSSTVSSSEAADRIPPWNATYRTRRRTPRRPLLGVRAPRICLQLHATPSDQTSRPPSEPTTRHSSSPLQLRPQFVEEALNHHERWRSRHVLPLVVSHHEKPPIVRRDRKRAPDRRSRAESVWDREQDLR
jgi:hypothetical protein